MPRKNARPEAKKARAKKLAAMNGKAPKREPAVCYIAHHSGVGMTLALMALAARRRATTNGEGE